MTELTWEQAEDQLRPGEDVDLRFPVRSVDIEYLVLPDGSSRPHFGDPPDGYPDPLRGLPAGTRREERTEQHPIATLFAVNESAGTARELGTASVEAL